MKKRFFISLAVSGMLIITGCQKKENLEVADQEIDQLEIPDVVNGEIIPGQYIVVLKENSMSFKSVNASYDDKVSEVKAFAESMVITKSASDYVVEQAYGMVLKGFSAKIADHILEVLQADSRVKYIEPDRYVSISSIKSATSVETQEIPYGITRVGYGDGTGKVAWIIDTGIDFDHPDLNVDTERSRNFYNTRRSADDDNGHGTHCAGTVAAIDNDEGVVGVAAGATMVAVKVLNRRGSGTISSVISGVDYVASAASPGDAVNISLGGGISTTLDNAVLAASSSGIYFAIAAGNEEDDANYYSPARVNGPYIWTISAMDDNDDFAVDFSNYGNPPVDYCEPGVEVLSTYPGGYAIGSGTSMAAPHMCGILLMTNGNPNTDGYVNNDPDGNPDPIGTL